MRPHAVVVAHRSAMVAEGLAAALSRYPYIVVLGAAVTLAECERRAERADAAAIDQYLAGAEEAATRLRRRGVRVVLIGEGSEEDEGVRVPARASVAALVSALVPHAPVAGFRAAPRGAPHTALGRGDASPAGGMPGAASIPSLTRRQREILFCIARGLSAKEVARQLGISPKTIEQHKTRIFSKLGVSNQTAAACLAVASGLGPDSWNPSSI